MGYDAFVHCRCWKDGVAEPFERDELVCLDDEQYFSLSIAFDERPEIWRAFDAWMRTACPHPNFELCRERLANAWGMAAFRHVIGLYPDVPSLLAEQLPRANGGHMAAELAGAALLELDAFASNGAFGEEAVLVDVATGEELYTSSAAGNAIWIYSLDGKVGIDGDGLFVIREGREVFRADQVQQEIVAPNERGQARANLRGDGAHVADVPALGGGAGYPATLRVDVRTDHSDNYGYIVGPLRRLCRAAVETGNPIVWC